MFEIKSIVQLDNIKGLQITDFLINCDDKKYQNWWPGTHLACHSLNKTPDHIGEILFMDEFVGHFRIRMKGRV